MNAWWTSHPMHLDDLLAGVDVHSDDLFWSMTLLCTPWICDAAMPKHCKPVPLAFAPPTPQPLCYFVLFISLLQMFESLSDCFCLNKVKHSNNNSKIILHLESPDWSLLAIFQQCRMERGGKSLSLPLNVVACFLLVLFYKVDLIWISKCNKLHCIQHQHFHWQHVCVQIKKQTFDMSQ